MKGDIMTHSTVTQKGQTTIPGAIREALRIKPGDRLEYALEGDHVSIRVHPGANALKGALASKKGRGLSFAKIREAAAAERGSGRAR
jgi:AbrB family looped-hinge helix DNA binding protein